MTDTPTPDVFLDCLGWCASCCVLALTMSEVVLQVLKDYLLNYVPPGSTAAAAAGSMPRQEAVEMHVES